MAATRTDIVVCYDVNTETKEGRKRLRQVAKGCEAYGQRVQFSVFECTLTDVGLDKLRARLLKIIDPEQDSLRFYFMPTGREKCVEVHGLSTYVSFEEPLVL